MMCLSRKYDTHNLIQEGRLLLFTITIVKPIRTVENDVIYIFNVIVWLFHQLPVSLLLERCYYVAYTNIVYNHQKNSFHFSPIRHIFVALSKESHSIVVSCRTHH